MYDLTTGQTTQVAQHDAPIKSVGWVDAPQGGILVTGSWDKTIKVRNTILLSFLPDFRIKTTYRGFFFILLA
jgi:WD40 repeat protein